MCVKDRCIFDTQSCVVIRRNKSDVRVTNGRSAGTGIQLNPLELMTSPITRDILASICPTHFSADSGVTASDVIRNQSVSCQMRKQNQPSSNHTKGDIVGHIGHPPSAMTLPEICYELP